MTDWMLYDFAKDHQDTEIKHRLAWLEKQGNNWFAELIEASNEQDKNKDRVCVADNQAKVYARQIQELTELAHQFGKLKGG